MASLSIPLFLTFFRQQAKAAAFTFRLKNTRENALLVPFRSVQFDHAKQTKRMYQEHPPLPSLPLPLSLVRKRISAAYHAKSNSFVKYFYYEHFGLICVARAIGNDEEDDHAKQILQRLVSEMTRNNALVNDYDRLGSEGNSWFDFARVEERARVFDKNCFYGGGAQFVGEQRQRQPQRRQQQQQRRGGGGQNEFQHSKTNTHKRVPQPRLPQHQRDHRGNLIGNFNRRKGQNNQVRREQRLTDEQKKVLYRSIVANSKEGRRLNDNKLEMVLVSSGMFGNSYMSSASVHRRRARRLEERAALGINCDEDGVPFDQPLNETQQRRLKEFREFKKNLGSPPSSVESDVVETFLRNHTGGITLSLACSPTTTMSSASSPPSLGESNPSSTPEFSTSDKDFENDTPPTFDLEKFVKDVSERLHVGPDDSIDSETTQYRDGGSSNKGTSSGASSFPSSLDVSHDQQ